jgi:hypothetical protein
MMTLSPDAVPSQEEGSYGPTPLEGRMHEILHLDNSLRQVSNTFNLTHGVFWNDYTESLVPVSAVCLIAQLIVGLLFCIYYAKLTRKNEQIKNRSDEKDRLLGDYSILPSIENHRRYDGMGKKLRFFLCSSSGAVAIIAILCVVVSQVLIVSYLLVVSGMDKWLDLLDYISYLGDDLTEDAYVLQDYGFLLEDDFYSSYAGGCDRASILMNDTAYYMHFIDKFIRNIEPVAITCSSIEDNINKGIDVSTMYLWFVYTWIALFVVICLWNVYSQFDSLKHISLAFGGALNLVLIVATATFMVLSVGVADFCMDPVPNVNKIVVPDITEYVTYYSNCQGINPFQQYVNWAYGYVTVTTSYVEDLLSHRECSGDPYLINSLNILNNISTTVECMSEDIVCPPLNDRLLNFLNYGMCRESFDGVFIAWFSHHVVVVALFSLLFLTQLAFHKTTSQNRNGIENDVAGLENDSYKDYQLIFDEE